ncbi:TPA: hypothetical protein ACH3X1_009845 [Trebouxia sp. C0004]
MASPMMLDGLDVVSALRSPAPLPLTAAASNGPAAPVREDAASPTSMAGFGSPIASPSSTIVSPSSTTAAAITAAAVLGNETAELACLDTFLPEEPSTRLHAMAPSGPQDSAISGVVSPFGGSGPESGTPGLAGVTASSPPVSAGPVDHPRAGPPADPAVSVEAGFGSPIATAAPTTAAVANVASAEDKAAPRRPALRPIAIKLGSRDCLQSGEGILTPSHPGALAQVNYRTPPSGEWAVFNSAASSDRAYQAQANRRAAQEAAAEAARASGLPNGSVLGVVSPRGGHSPQDTPKLLQADRQVLNECRVSTSGQEQGKLMSMALDGVGQHPSPAGTPRDGSAFTTPAAGPGLGMHGVSIQSRGQGQMPTGASPGAQNEAQTMRTPHLWLPDLTPPTNVARPQDSQDMAPAQEDQTPTVAQAVPSTAVATNGPPAQDKAASRQAIIINLGDWSLPQPGDGFVTPSLPGASAQGNYKTPPSGQWAVYDNVASSDCAYQAQAARRVLQGADAEAARVPGGANGSALGVVSPRGGGHTPQNTPDFLAMVFSNELFEPEAGTQVLEEAQQEWAGPGQAEDGVSFSTPAASSAVGVHGTSMQSHGGPIQSHGGGQMSTGISPGAQGNDVMTGDQDNVNAQAAGSPRAVSPATAKASSSPMTNFGPTAVLAASSTASVAAAGSSAGPAAAPTAIASVEAAEVFTVPTAASPADAGFCAGLLSPPAAAVRTAGQGMSLDGVAQQPSSAGIPRGYVMTTPDFYLPVLTPLSSTPLSQHSQDFVPHQDSAVAQPASSPRAASPATAGASLIPMAFPQPMAFPWTAEAPAANEGNLSPSQLHCSNRQRRTPREDASLSNDAAAPRQAAAMQPTLQLGKLTGVNLKVAGKHLAISSCTGTVRNTDAVDAAAQKHTLHPTGGTHRPGVVSNNAAEVHTAGVNTSEQQQAGMPLLGPGWGKPPHYPRGTGLTRHQKRSRTDTTCQAETDGPSPSDEPRLKQHKPSAGEKEWGQQAPASKGHSTAGEEEANRQVAGGGEEQGEEAVVGHSKEQGEAASAAQAAPALPWGSMPPGAYSFTEGTAQLKAHRSQRDQPNSAKLKKRGGNVAPFMHGPAPSQAAQQGQHHAALSQPAHAPDSAAMPNTAHESAPPVAAESASPVAAESAPPLAAESAPPLAAESAPPLAAASAPPAAAKATASMVAGPPSSRAADLATASTAGSASGGGADEEAREGTGHTSIVDSLSDSTMAEGCVQHPAVLGAHPEPQAVHVSGQNNSSTAAPVGGTNAELPSDTAREEACPSRAECARNPSSAVADTTVGYEDSQAGHVQDSPASVTHDAAREEAHPSRDGSTGNLSSAAAVSSSAACMSIKHKLTGIG